MKTAHKVFLAILVAYFVFALVMLCVISQKEYVDSFDQFLYIGSQIGDIMLISAICLHTDLNKKPVHWQEPNLSSLNYRRLVDAALFHTTHR